MKNYCCTERLKFISLRCFCSPLYKLSWHVCVCEFSTDLQIPIRAPYVHFKREKTLSMITSACVRASR